MIALSQRFLIFIALLSSGLSAQQIVLPLSNEFDLLYEKELQAVGVDYHTTHRPLISSNVLGLVDSVLVSDFGSTGPSDKFLKRKLFYEHLLKIKGKQYEVVANPLMGFFAGKDSSKDGLIYNNTRGVQIKGLLGDRVRFYSEFYENQSRFPQYVDNFIRRNRVVPGALIPKPFKSDAYDYFYANGFVNLESRNEIFNVQFGHGKHFLGNGYRSMLLSDNSFNYPYLKIQTNFWKIQYMNLFTKMTDINSILSNGTFVPKYTTLHHLSVNLTKRLNVGFFEANVYHDSLGTRGYDVNFLNPVIFYRAVESGLGRFDVGNSLLGMDAKFKINNQFYTYGQFLLDEFNFNKLKEDKGWWGNKYSWQIGLKYFDFLTDGLMVQLEYNSARPYTYTHFTPLQNYGHYNNSLAHPLGANFNEFVFIANYKKERYIIDVKFLVANKGIDSGNENWGGDIYLSYDDREIEFGNVIGQGQAVSTINAQLQLSYLLNPNYNLRLFASAAYRSAQVEDNLNHPDHLESTIFQFGLKTGLNNVYFDF